MDRRGYFAEDLNLDNLAGSIEWEHADEYSKVIAGVPDGPRLPGPWWLGHRLISRGQPWGLAPHVTTDGSYPVEISEYHGCVLLLIRTRLASPLFTGYKSVSWYSDEMW